MNIVRWYSRVSAAYNLNGCPGIFCHGKVCSHAFEFIKKCARLDQEFQLHDQTMHQ